MIERKASRAKAVTQRMAHLAQHDFLASLPNRLLFADRVANAVALAQRDGKKCAVLFIGLDGFKHVNDSLGHPVGDEILQSASRRLAFCVRGPGIVSRQSGDEFAVLLSEIECTADAALGAHKLLWVLAAPHRVAGKELIVSASIGVSIYPGDGEDAQTLIRCADAAMHQAKRVGRNSFRLFTAAAIQTAADDVHAQSTRNM